MTAVVGVTVYRGCAVIEFSELLQISSPVDSLFKTDFQMRVLVRVRRQFVVLVVFREGVRLYIW